MEAKRLDREIKESVEYASNASPAPTASTNLFTKDGIENDIGLLDFETPTAPFDPNFKIKFLKFGNLLQPSG